eukprot:s46_g38.t1
MPLPDRHQVRAPRSSSCHQRKSLRSGRCFNPGAPELGSQWLPAASEHAETFVLEAPGPRINGGILGVYVLHPAAHGRGSHIAHGLYMVHPDVRGRGYGKALSITATTGRSMAGGMWQTLGLVLVWQASAAAQSRDIIKKVVHTPWWPAGSEKTAESVGIISHGLVYMTAMMEVNETLQKTALQETWDVRDIALAAGANLTDLVDCFVNAPKGHGDVVKGALMSAFPAEVQASPPAFTVVEMPGEYQFVYNSIMCVANIPDGESKRHTVRKNGLYGVSARGLTFYEGAVAPGTISGAYEETLDIVNRMLPSTGSVLVDCTAYLASIRDAQAVRKAIIEVTGMKGFIQPSLTIVQAGGLANRSLRLRCTAAVDDSRLRSVDTTDGKVVLTDSFAFASAQLDRNSTGVNALETLGKVLKYANVTLNDPCWASGEYEAITETQQMSDDLDRVPSRRQVHCCHCSSTAAAYGRYGGGPLRSFAGRNHSVSEARKRGFQGMRINMVVASNFAAQRVASACGFRVLCVLPRAFQHPERGLVDTMLLFNDLSCDKGLVAPAPRPTVASCANRPCSESAGSHVSPAISAVVSAGSEVHLQPCGAPDARELQKKPVNPQTDAGFTFWGGENAHAMEKGGDGLELCKQAVALLVGDMRAEIQQAVGLLKSEAENATASKNPLATKLLGVADNLQNACTAQDALGKMRELLTHSHWELGQRLDQQMQVNALMSDHLGASRDLTVDTVQRIEQCEANGPEIVIGVSAQVDNESQAVQSHSRQQTSDLEGRFLQQLSTVRSEVDAQIVGSSEKLLGALGRLQDETLRGNEGITTSLGCNDQGLGVVLDSVGPECDCERAWGTAAEGVVSDSLMSDRIADLEEEVSELRQQLDQLRLDFTRLRREVRATRRSSESERGTGDDQGQLSDGSYSVVSRPERTASGYPSPSRSEDSRNPRGGSPPLPPSSRSSQQAITWIRREEIADNIGRFFARCLAGEHRGASGRDLNPLPSRVWVVCRDYQGQIYTPVRVFRSWGSCKTLCKHFEDVGDSVFCGFPSEREARRAIAAAELEWPPGTVNKDFEVQLFINDLDTGTGTFPVLLVAEFEEKTLVAVPHEAWHRVGNRRKMVQNGLLKPVVAEVLVADYDTRDILEPELYIKCWVGFLRSELGVQLQAMTEMSDCDFTFGLHEGKYILPSAESLAAAANEHFAFFSAEEEQQEAVEQVANDPAGHGPAEVANDPAGHGPAEVEDVGSAPPLEGRVQKIEDILTTLTTGVNQLLARAKKESEAKEKAPGQQPTVQQPAQSGKMTAYPNLDPGVVQAALQAGIPHQNLVQMEKLVSQNQRAKKVKEAAKPLVLDPLSEDEGDNNEGDGSGSPERDPMTDTLAKLTTIVEYLAADKKKAQNVSKLDQALDSAQTASSSDGVSIGVAKKNAAARLALRNTFQKHPEEISAILERLMYEDLASQTLAPGLPPLGLNARAWVEFRSRINSYKTGAHCAWAFAGILDCLISNQPAAARARAALALLQLDQAAIDRGNWNVAGELSLELAPPMASLATHVPPNIHDGEAPYSKLLDARWAEITLGHLREQEEYLNRRKALGRAAGKNAKDEGEETSAAEVRRRPKAKAKAKAAAAAEKSADN